MKKQKSFWEKMNNIKPNSSIKLTAKDRADEWWKYEDIIGQKKKEHLNFWFLILGLIFGIVGSYVSTQIYDFSKNILLMKSGFKAYFLFNIFIWLIFGITITIFVIKIKSNNNEVKELKKMQKRWSTARSLNIGKGYSPEYLEKFNEKINIQIKTEILKKIKNKKFSLWNFSKKTNLTIEHIKRYLKELKNESIIKVGGVLFWKNYSINQQLKTNKPKK
jgi:hypothetical protein